MRVGIDARLIDLVHKTGIGIYGKELISNLAKYDKDNEYVLFFSSLRRKSNNMPGPTQRNFAKKVVPLPYIRSHLVSKLWQNIFLPSALRLEKVDVFHETFSPYIRKVRGIKTVITVHDLHLLMFPNADFQHNIKLYTTLYTKAIEVADICIAVSESTKVDMIKYFSVTPEKIRVIYEGVSERFHPIDDLSVIGDFKEKFGLPEGIILTVGIGHRKNTQRLIQAYRVLKEKHRIERKLVITGKPKFWNFEMTQLIGRLNLNEDIIFLGYFPEEELPILYNSSDLFVFPSLYEGFGFPLLEAMKCGVPVVTSNISSMPEIVGDAGLLVDPYNEYEIAEAIAKVLSDGDLRTKLKTKGMERAKKFTWEETVKKTIGVYREVHEKL